MRNMINPNFTPRAQKAISSAKRIAFELNNKEVLPIHLLISILETRQFTVSNIFENLSIDMVSFSMVLQEVCVQRDPVVTIEYGADFKEKIKESHKYASKLSHDYVGLEHMLFVCIRDEKLSLYLEEFGYSPKQVLTAIENHIIVSQSQSNEAVPTLDETPSRQKRSAEPNPDTAIAKFCIDYNQLAKEGRLGEVFFKDSEMNQISEVLCRKSKNNPVLLGDAGVGKTAIVEGLAQKIVDQNCAEFLLNTRVLALDLPSMIAGTKYRGQFEERLKNLIKEVVETKNIILFIDEIHTLVGAGNSEGSMDAANILKPALARGEVRLIGATTYEEYKKSFIKDAALDRRFHAVPVLEPSVDQAIEILRKVSKSYEKFHGVKFNEDSLRSAVELSKKYINDRFLPDKAIDLIDQAASKVKIKAFKRPPKIRNLESQLEILFQIEENSFGKEKASAMKRAEKKFESYRKELEAWAEECKTKGADVTEEDICRVVSEKTKIPYSKIHKDYSSEALGLNSRLKSNVIGQDESIDVISDSVIFSFSGLAQNRGTMGSFLLLGSTGLGKSYTTKCVADALFERHDALIQYDMSEFSEKTSVSRLIGASPGYVGYEEGGKLVEQVKRNPYSVVVFDEAEKAHEDVLNLLLQILEEGKLTDNLGQVADFSNCLVFLTSNVGASAYEDAKSMGFVCSESSKEEVESLVKKEAKKHFKLELLNRIDKIIAYNKLSHKDLRKIFNIEVSNFRKQLKKQGISLRVSSKVREEICSRAEKENMGARPLKKIFREEIQSVIAKKIVELNHDINGFSFKFADGKIFCEVE